VEEEGGADLQWLLSLAVMLVAKWRWLQAAILLLLSSASLQFFFLFFLCFSLLFSFDLQLLPSSVLLLPLSFFFSTIFPIFIGKIGEREARAATVQPP
jgi:hypothetical protein